MVQPNIYACTCIHIHALIQMHPYTHTAHTNVYAHVPTLTRADKFTMPCSMVMLVTILTWAPPATPTHSLGACPDFNANPPPSQESEDLEKQNAALRKEIKQLTEEMKYFTSVLSSHEPLCSVMAASAPSPPEVVYSAHAFHQPHVSSPRFQP